MRLRALQPDNPILRAEMAYQRRTIPRGLQWFDRFGVVVVALVVSVGLLYFPAANDLYGTSWTPPQPLLSMLLPVLWTTQTLVIVRCLFAGLNTMRHHRGQQESDILALTGISPRQLFLGKWWSALYQIRGWLLALGLIKLAVGALVIISLIVYCYRNPLDSLIRNVDYYSHGPRPLLESALLQLPTEFPALPSVERIMITGVHTVAITILEVMVSTALGVTGGFVLRKMFGFASMVVLRFAPVIIFTLFPNKVYTIGGLMWGWYEYTWFSLADGGSTAILRAGLTNRGRFISGNNLTNSILLAFYAAIAMYLAYLVFAFVVSNFILRRRQGFLPAGSK